MGTTLFFHVFTPHAGLFNNEVLAFVSPVLPLSVVFRRRIARATMRAGGWLRRLPRRILLWTKSSWRLLLITAFIVNLGMIVGLAHWGTMIVETPYGSVAMRSHIGMPHPTCLRFNPADATACVHTNDGFIDSGGEVYWINQSQLLKDISNQAADSECRTGQPSLESIIKSSLSRQKEPIFRHMVWALMLGVALAAGIVMLVLVAEVGVTGLPEAYRSSTRTVRILRMMGPLALVGILAYAGLAARSFNPSGQVTWSGKDASLVRSELPQYITSAKNLLSDVRKNRQALLSFADTKHLPEVRDMVLAIAPDDNGAQPAGPSQSENGRAC